MRQLYFRLKYRLGRLLNRAFFYYEVLRHPVIVRNRPLARTYGQVHDLIAIIFTEHGVILRFVGARIVGQGQMQINKSTMSIGKEVYPMEINPPLLVCHGDTFMPTWELHFTKLPNDEKD